MKQFWMASVAAAVLVLGACSVETTTAGSAGSADASPGASRGDGAYGASPSSGSSSGGTSSSEAGDPPPGPGGADASSSTGTAPTAQSGLLTAGVWDDNLNFAFFEGYLQATAPSVYGVPSFSAAERQAAQQKWSQRTGSSELDVTFLIDTTGSMGDELSYLQAEIDGISQRLKEKFPQTTPRYGLVLYKDAGDAYVTRTFDFKGIQEFQSNLAQQTVGGGGDYPEAVAAGLGEAMKLSWRSGAVSRLTFWVADAPHHLGEEAAVRAAIDVAVQKDIHVYPVAASGADDRTELTMRSAAQITGGRYVFLTDDSGVGNPHAEPHIPCYHVTRFDGAIVRMVESELSGTHVEPKAEEIIRTVGSPQNGQCTTKSSGTVRIY